MPYKSTKKSTAKKKSTVKKPTKKPLKKPIRKPAPPKILKRSLKKPAKPAQKVPVYTGSHSDAPRFSPLPHQYKLVLTIQRRKRYASCKNTKSYIQLIKEAIPGIMSARGVIEYTSSWFTNYLEDFKFLDDPNYISPGRIKHPPICVKSYIEKIMKLPTPEDELTLYARNKKNLTDYKISIGELKPRDEKTHRNRQPIIHRMRMGRYIRHICSKPIPTFTDEAYYMIENIMLTVMEKLILKSYKSAFDREMRYRPKVGSWNRHRERVTTAEPGRIRVEYEDMVKAIDSLNLDAHLTNIPLYSAGPNQPKKESRYYKEIKNPTSPHNNLTTSHPSDAQYIKQERLKKSKKLNDPDSIDKLDKLDTIDTIDDPDTST